MCNIWIVEFMLPKDGYEILSRLMPLHCMVLPCNCYQVLEQLQTPAAVLSTSKEVSVMGHTEKLAPLRKR